MDAPDFSAPLLQAISALAEQVWILRDRERVLEEVLARHGLDVPTTQALVDGIRAGEV